MIRLISEATIWRGCSFLRIPSPLSSPAVPIIFRVSISSMTQAEYQLSSQDLPGVLVRMCSGSKEVALGRRSAVFMHFSVGPFWPGHWLSVLLPMGLP